MQGATEPRARWTPGPRLAAPLHGVVEDTGATYEVGTSSRTLG
jgi:hypothetical protein